MKAQSGVSSSPLVASYLPEVSKPYAEGIISGVIVAAAFVFAELILHALAWSEVLVGNLIAAAAMGGYLWHRHPNLKIRP